MLNNKAITAFGAAVGTGVGFVITSGVIHGTALVITQAVLAAVDTALSTLGVYYAKYVPAPQPAPPPAHAV
jgi:hypothetical protein